MHSPFWQNLFQPHHKLHKHIRDLWLTTPIFKDVNATQCLSLVQHMPLRRYQAGEAIFSQGEIGIGTGLILHGQVAICSGDRALANLNEGDFFGEVALVIEAPRTATARATSECEVVFFLRPQLDELLVHAPKLAARLMQNLAWVMASRLGSTNALLEAQHDN